MGNLDKLDGIEEKVHPSLQPQDHLQITDFSALTPGEAELLTQLRMKLEHDETFRREELEALKAIETKVRILSPDEIPARLSRLQADLMEIRNRWPAYLRGEEPSPMSALLLMASWNLLSSIKRFDSRPEVQQLARSCEKLFNAIAKLPQPEPKPEPPPPDPEPAPAPIVLVPAQPTLKPETTKPAPPSGPDLLKEIINQTSAIPRPPRRGHRPWKPCPDQGGR